MALGGKKKKRKRIACIDLIILKQLRRISCFEALGNHQQGLGGNTLLNRLLAKGVFSFLCVTFPEAVQTGHSWIWGEGKIKIIFPKSYSLPRMPEWWWCLDPNSSPKLTSDKNLPAGPSRSRKTSVLACSVRALIREKRFDHIIKSHSWKRLGVAAIAAVLPVFFPGPRQFEGFQSPAHSSSEGFRFNLVSKEKQAQKFTAYDWCDFLLLLYSD